MAAPDAKLNANPPGVGMICVRVSVEVKVSAGDIEVFSNFFCFKYHWSESFFFFFPPPVDLNQQLGKERNKTKLKDKACSGY